VLVVLYPDEGLLSSKPKCWCYFYVFALNLIWFKHVKAAIKMNTPEEHKPKI